MSLFESGNYKTAVLELIEQMPKQGYGQFRKIAEHLNVSSVIVSQVFKGNRDLSQEQAFDLAAYFGFSDLETRYFLLLVQKERAGNHKLKKYFEAQLSEIREKSKELKNRVRKDTELSESTKAIFYSNWYYSGIRLLSSIDGYQNVDAIADHLSLPRATVKRVADFLIEHGLMIDDEGKLKMGPKTTHLESTSPLVSRHHSNWRMRGMNNMEALSPEELFYTGPMSLSNEAMNWVRTELVSLIERVVTHVSASESERLACLNIDWFDFRGRKS
jgi:uncharacterized protein (TIGR02147 family)